MKGRSVTRTATLLLTTGLLTLSTGLGTGLGTGWAGGLSPAAAAPASGVRWGAGRSHPVEDSYYPSEGDPGVDALHYHLDLSWRPRKQRLLGVARIVLRATHKAPDFQLDLGSTLRVRSVRVDGRAVHSSHVGKTLHVKRPVRPDHRYRVRIDYAGTPQPVKAPTTRTDMSGLGWHTTTDRPGVERCRSRSARSRGTPSTTSLPTRRPTTSGSTCRGRGSGSPTAGWSAGPRARPDGHPVPPPRPDGVLPHDRRDRPLRRCTQTGPHGLPLNYWVPRDNRRYLAPLRRRPPTLRWLESRLGPYPFDRAGIVVTPSDSAMETQTMVTFGARELPLRRAQRAADGRARALARLVRRHRHPRRLADVWMNEGMAMYVETRFRVAQRLDHLRPTGTASGSATTSCGAHLRPAGALPPPRVRPDQRLLLPGADVRPAPRCGSAPEVRPAGAPLAAAAPRHQPDPRHVRGVVGAQDRARPGPVLPALAVVGTPPPEPPATERQR